jgi:thymidylate synthase
LKVGELIISTGDTHIYKDHVEQVNEQLSRTPLEAPDLWLNPEIRDIEKFTMNDIALLDYKSMDSIKAKMAV